MKNTNKIKVDLQTALTPLFVPVNDSEKRNITTVIRRKTSDGYIDFTCPWILDDKDEDVMLAILSLVQDKERGKQLISEPVTTIGKRARESLDAIDSLADKPAGFLITTINELAMVLGYKSASDQTYNRIRSSLKRLSAVVINERIESEKREIYGGSGFIRTSVEDKGKIVIAICHRLSMAAFGVDGWKYANTSLDERLSLKSAVSKEVHRFLTAWKREGKEGAIGLIRLCINVYGTEKWNFLTPNAQQIAWTKVKSALLEINEIPGWNIEISGKARSAIISIKRATRLKKIN